MVRPRKSGNKGLPINLHKKFDKRTGNTNFSYRHPHTHKEYGLGIDRETAIIDANAINATIYTSVRAAKIAAIAAIRSQALPISTPAQIPALGQKANNPKNDHDIPPEKATLAILVSKHLEICEERGLAKGSIRNRHYHCETWKKELGSNTIIKNVSVRDIVKVIQSYNDRRRTAQAMRQAAIDLWTDAIQEGWAETNIPAVTRRPDLEDVKRSRLSVEDFNRIHAAALTFDPWVARAMELALVTAQRREDIAVFEFRKRNESTSWLDSESEMLHVMQLKSKCKIKVKIPLTVGINGFTLCEIIKSCRDDVMSRYMVHFQRNSPQARAGNGVSLQSLTKGFAKARDLAGIEVEEGKDPASLHEIRSLSIRLYKEKYGQDFSQAIAGHKNAKTSALYQDTRGMEWVVVGGRS